MSQLIVPCMISIDVSMVNVLTHNGIYIPRDLTFRKVGEMKKTTKIVRIALSRRYSTWAHPEYNSDVFLVAPSCSVKENAVFYLCNAALLRLQCGPSSFAMQPLYLWNASSLPWQCDRYTFKVRPFYLVKAALLPLQCGPSTFAVRPFDIRNAALVPLKCLQSTFAMRPFYI
jgi:hypothetical protein